MLQSTVINNRQHVGLQKLSVLGAVSHSFLGPAKKLKFIQDDTGGESALVCSCYQILESLELPCAVGQLVSETVRAHHKVYHTGSGCLLFLAGAWSRAALDCLQKGISINHLISAMSEGMDICMEVCRKSAFSFENICGWMPSERDAQGLHRQLLNESSTEASQESCPVRRRQGVGDKTLNISERRKIKLSRHFCEAKSENITEAPPQPQTPDIAHIAQGLSHGCDDIMKLVVEAFQMQSEMNQPNTGSPMFDISKVVTCVLPALPERCSCVMPGCVVLLSAEQASLAHHLNEQNLKVVFMTGDLTENYRHLGFKKLGGIQSVRERLSESSTEEDWVKRVGDLFLRLGVNLILVSGLVCEKVVQRCWRHQILTVEKVKPSILKALADSAGAVPVSYATQLTVHCVGSGVKLQIWRDLRTLDGTSVTAVNISTDGNSRLLTAILTSCLRGKLLTLEEQFWACAYRLHHAMKDKALLPGAGRVEMLCVHHLQKQVENNVKNVTQKNKEQAGNYYKGVVLELMADGLIDYISTVMANTGRFSKVKARTLISQRLGEVEEEQGFAEKISQLSLGGDKDEDPVSSEVDVFDNLSVKQEAWRKALDVVLLVLQTDAEIITGEGRDSDAAQGYLRL